MLVTRQVVDAAAAVRTVLRFELIGEIGLKGFSEPVELFHAFPRRSRSGWHGLP